MNLLEEKVFQQKQSMRKLEDKIEDLKTKAIRCLSHLKNGQYESLEYLLNQMILTDKRNDN